MPIGMFATTPSRLTDLTGKQCDPTNASCIDPSETEDNQELVCRADDSSSSSTVASVSSSSAGAALGAAAMSTPAPTGALPTAPPGTDFAAEAAQARAAYRAANVMPPGTQVQHWTKELSAQAANLDPAIMNQNLSPLQTSGRATGPWNATSQGPATTLLTDPAGGQTRYSVLGGSVYGNEHRFADRFLIPQIENQIRAANPGAPAGEASIEAGRQARWIMTGDPGPSPLIPAPGMEASARWFAGAGGALNVAGGAFMLASVDTKNDPGIVTAGKITSGTASLAGGGLEVGGALTASAGAVEAGAALSGVGLIIAAPIMVYEMRPRGMIAYDQQLADKAIAEGRNPFCAQCHGPGGALDPNNDWNSGDPARRAAFVRRLQWVDLGH